MRLRLICRWLELLRLLLRLRVRLWRATKARVLLVLLRRLRVALLRLLLPIALLRLAIRPTATLTVAATLLRRLVAVLPIVVVCHLRRLLLLLLLRLWLLSGLLLGVEVEGGLLRVVALIADRHINVFKREVRRLHMVDLRDGHSK